MPLIPLILAIVAYLPVILISSLLHPAFAATQWVIDGDALNMANNDDTLFAVTPHALAPTLIFHGDAPYVAWAEISSKGVSIVYVKHKDGKKWAVAGEPLNLSINSNASFASLSSAGNRLCAVWTEEDGNKINQVYVKEWDGSEWKQIGGSLNADPGDPASSPVILCDKTFCYAAWTEFSSGNVSHLYVRQWDGTSWRIIGDKLNNDPGRHALTPSFAAAKSGVYLTWSEYNKDGVAQLYVSQWNGTEWSLTGDALNIDRAGHALSPSISIAGTTPYIAWMEYNEEAVFRIYVKSWDSKNGWVRLGEVVNVDKKRHASNPSLALNDNVPYVTWIESAEDGIPNIYAKHWDGKTWVRDGEFVNDTQLVSESVSAPSISIRNKSVYVAFSETDANAIFRLYIKQLTVGKADASRKETRPIADDTTGAARRFFTAIPKEARATADLPPPLAFKSLQRTPLGEVDWMSGIRQGVYKPFDSTDPEARPALPPYDLDMVLPVKKEFGIPQVIFPHSSHTMWLDCRNCHPAIFAPKRGANPITMHGVLEGKYCAKCHGIVAFQLYDCSRCHSK